MDLAQLGLSLEAQPMLTGLEKVDAALVATAAKAEALAGKIKSATARMATSLKSMGGGGRGATDQLTIEQKKLEENGAILQRQLVSQQVEADRQKLASTKATVAAQIALGRDMIAAQRNTLISQGKSANASTLFSGPAAGPSVWQAAGIRSPEETVTQIKAVSAAMAELKTRHASTAEEALANSRAHDALTSAMNVLTTGNARARGAFRQTAAAIASMTFEMVGAVYGLGMLAGALAAPAIFGFKLESSLEQTKLGFAAILISLGEINGEAIKLPQALQIGAKLTKEIQENALKYGVNIKSLADTTQAIMGPGLTAGLDPLTQIPKLALAGAIAVKTLKLDARQSVQEIRDLVAGGIQSASSTVARVIGVNDKLVKEWTKAGTLYENLMERLGGFQDTAILNAETLAGAWDIFVQKIQLAFTNSELFDQFKKNLIEVSDWIGKINKETGKFEFNPAVTSAMWNYWEALKGVWAVLKEIGSALSWINPLFQTLAVLVANTKYVFTQVGKEIGGVAAQIAALARGDISGFREIGRLMREDAKAARLEVDQLSERLLGLGRSTRQMIEELGQAIKRLPAQQGLKLGFSEVPQAQIKITAKPGLLPEPKAPKAAKADPYEGVHDSVGKLFTELTKLEGVQKAVESGNYTSIAQIEAIQRVADLLAGLKDKTKAVFEARLSKDFAGQFAAAGIAGGTLEDRLVRLITRQKELTDRTNEAVQARRKHDQDVIDLPKDLASVNKMLQSIEEQVIVSSAELSGKASLVTAETEKKLTELWAKGRDEILKNSVLGLDQKMKLFDELTAKVGALRDNLQSLDAIKISKDIFAGAQSIISSGQASIQVEQNTGLISEAEARQKLRDLYKQQADVLTTSLIPALREQIAVATDPVQRAAMQAMIDQIREMQYLGREKSGMEGMLRGLNDYMGSAADTFTNAKEVMTRALGGVEDALVTLATTGKLSFKSMADGIVADIDRMIIKSTVMPAITNMLGLTVNGKPNAQSGILGMIGSLVGGSDSSKPDGSSPFRAIWVQPVGGATGILGATGATGGSSGSLFGSLGNLVSGLFGGPSTASAAVTAAAGGASMGFAMPAFASGIDYVPHDMVARIHQGERVVPASENKPGLGGGGDSISVVTNITVAGNTDTRTANQIGLEVGRQVQKAMRRNG
jgi:hypothetical protein